VDTHPGEAIYLWLFEDVRQAVQRGLVASGELHYRQCGRREIELGLRQRQDRRAPSLAWPHGNGTECGALHDPLGIFPDPARVTHVGRLDEHSLRRHYPGLADEPLVPVGIIDDGEVMRSCGPERQTRSPRQAE
jgi:hypothetical protein